MYGAKPYQFEPTYRLLSTERRTSGKGRKNAELYYVVSSKNICWQLKFCAVMLGPRFAHKLFFFKSRNATCAKYIWKSILHIVQFLVYIQLVADIILVLDFRERINSCWHAYCICICDCTKKMEVLLKWTTNLFWSKKPLSNKWQKETGNFSRRVCTCLI